MNGFSELDQDKLTMSKIKAAVVKVMKWKRVAEALLMADKEETIEEMESELERLMVGLDGKVKLTSSKGSSTSLSPYYRLAIILLWQQKHFAASPPRCSSRWRRRRM